MPAYWLLAAYIAVSLVVRAPSFLYSELNWDEALYRLMADSLLQGHAPYTEIWDRKPVGVFLVFAAIQGLFGENILALRLVTSIGVGVSAFLLALLGRRLFPTERNTGVVAGFLYIFYSMLSGGEGTNTELVFTPFYLAGAVILFGSAMREGRLQRLPAFVAGLLVGIAIQIKYIVIFDILAFAAIYLITQFQRYDRESLLRFFGMSLVTGVGILLPTVAVVLWYWGIGRIDAFLLSNIVANEALVGSTAPDFSLRGLIGGLRQYDVLALGAAVAILAGPFLADTPERRRSWLAIVVWLAAMGLSLLFLRRFADHFFIQTLPAMSVATAWIAIRMSEAAPLRPNVKNALMLGGVVLVGLWAAHSSFDAAFETLSKRSRDGIAHWGDRTATVAAALRDRLGPSDEIYVLGRTLGVYAATDRQPPTSLVFAEHLWQGYAPFDGAEEIRRILERHPAFIVVDDLWLPDALSPEPARDRITAILHDAIARDYVPDGKVSRFTSGGGGFVGGGIGVTVFRRRDIAPYNETARLQYEPSS